MRKIHYLTTAQAAEIVGVTRQRIEHLVRKGRLGDYRAYGRRVIARDELYRWASRRRRKLSTRIAKDRNR